MIPALLASLSGCGPGVPEPIARFECNRCHTSTSFAQAPDAKNCRGCHQDVLDGAYDTWRYDPAHVAGWKANLKHFVDVPTLTGADRFERSWLIAFLQEPHDLRPQLEESMPRMPIGPREAEALADALGATDRNGAVTGDARRGRALFAAKGCGACHAFTGAELPPPQAPAVPVDARALALAPDLRHTRRRLDPTVVERWLADPSTVKADAVMPRVRTTPAERADLVAALFETPLATQPRPAIPKRLPLLERQVTWDEVWERVFSRTCRHCHADGVAGDAGPGNTGGFGHPGKRLDLGSEQAVRHGKDGVSVLDPRDDAPLLKHLWARHAEVAGQPVAGVLGMPLGLPPVPAEDLQLLETWIRQQP